MEKIDFKIKRKLNPLEEGAFDIIKKLKANSYEAYIAGGAVRDLYLERDLHDIDIATSAKPQEIKKIFPESYDRGKAFGVVAVKSGDFEYEVATFRSDLGIADHRRPQSVVFVDAERDATRRDFTVNALFYDPVENNIIDYVGGREDLQAKIIRFVGRPSERIDEDYLRMLRAIRFAYRLDFTLESKTEEAIKKEARKITVISTERIRDELTNILTGERRDAALEKMAELGLLQAILPEVLKMKGVEQPPEFHSEGDVWTHTLMAFKSLDDPSAELAWTVLLHDIGKPLTQGFREHPKSKITFFEHDTKSAELARKILERLKFSNAFTEACAWAISQHMRIINAFRGMSERKQKKLFTDPHIELLLDLTKADLGSSVRPHGRPEMAMYEDALKKRQCFQKETTAEEAEAIKQFNLITGRDIMEILGIPPGPKVGEVKSRIEEAFLDGKISTRTEALDMIKHS